MADPYPASELTERQPFETFLTERALSLRDQRGAEGAVVVGAVGRWQNPSGNVARDNFVVSAYYVAPDYFDREGTADGLLPHSQSPRLERSQDGRISCAQRHGLRLSFEV